MSKPSNREKILTEGMRVVLRRGFGGASVRDIVQAAGVPQGSFTNHFASKEAFGLELLDIYLDNSRKLIAATLLDERRPALDGLHAFIQANKDRQLEDGPHHGCLSGNFSAEAGDLGENIRLRLVTVFAEIHAAVERCLRRAVRERALAADTACERLAGVIISSLQGAILLSKVQRSLAPLDDFDTVLFAALLPLRRSASPTSSPALTPHYV